MKNQTLKDERVINGKRKIQSHGFQIVWLVLLITVLIQQYLYKAPFTQYAVEFLIVIGMSIYVVIANIIIGNDIFNSKKRGQLIIVINSIVTGISVSVISTIINYINYSDKIQHPTPIHLALVSGITFLSTTALAFIVLEIFYFINNKKQEAIDKKLNEDDISE
ncbi:DUF6773 family protein [Robinsoniella sp. KNHs210]|uniref:DUF6773 family protein n=1 Tax=Robinsoniella sp. KNHs210 TaxID=1469950 RepID=UPI00048104F8|nr:DUF6773 family protein [Robinsoniella sp. KNHs210]